MTTSSDPAEGTDTNGAAAPDLAVGEIPFLPEPVRVVAPEPEPIVFDAKAMVESQKRAKANPAYGALPTATDANREAAEKLREKAHRKRSRNKILVRVVAVLFLGGAGAAGWFVYTAYQDEQDQRAIELAEAQDDDAPAAEPLTPLGEQVEVIGALDNVNSGATGGAGALLDAIDDAREVMGETNGDAGAGAATPAGSALTVDLVLSDYVRTSGERLPDPDGREIYVVDADDFAAAAPDAFRTFLRTLAALPQRSPSDPAFAGFPAVANDEIIVAADRDGDTLRRVTVKSAKLNLHVDATP